MPGSFVLLSDEELNKFSKRLEREHEKENYARFEGFHGISRHFQQEKRNGG